jgi:DNA-binding transcriptional LysR family regulator
MDRLECDRMFIAVMETGGFSRAAERLGTSPGQASKLIGRLEAELGVQLLNRTTRALSPTEVGQAYYERIKTLIEEFDALDASVRTASGEARGRLALTVPETFGTAQLQAALVDFARAYPQIVLDVSFSDRVANLIDEGFDAAIRVGAPADASLIVRKLCDIRTVVAASPDYLARRGEPADPTELPAHDCIIDTNFRDPLIWRFRAPDGRGTTRINVAGRLRFSNGEACVAAAEAGLGIVRAPTFVAGPRIRAGALKAVLRPFEEPPEGGLHILYPPSRQLALKVRVLVDFLAARFRGEPPWDQGW